MEQNRPLTIAIAGMGLIGGSMALALKSRTKYTVIGIDNNEAVLDAVLAAGAADQTGIVHLQDADVLILAMPPSGATDFLAANAKRLHPGTVVTDVCGVKRAVTEACLPVCRAHGLHFIGGHPMAGRERSGFANATPELFNGASYILTPSENSPEFALKTLEGLAYGIGCGNVTVTTPEHHDKMIAFTSQLPHVLAGAYVKSPRCPEHKGYSAGSYRDVSRVATVDEKLWTQLFLMNADNLCEEIDYLIDNLRECRDAVAAGDSLWLAGVLREGRLRKERVTE